MSISTNGRLAASASIIVLGLISTVWAGDFTLQPRLEVGVIASDNFRRQSSDQQNAVAFRVQPGIFAQSDGGRIDYRLGASLEGLYFLVGDEDVSSRSEMAAQASVEVIPENLVFEVEALLQQVLLQPGSNFNEGGQPLVDDNESDVFTLTLGPRYRQRFGSFAELDSSYAYSLVRSSGPEGIDSDIQTFDLSLASGRRFLAWNWLVDASLQYQEQQSGDSVLGDEATEREELVGEVDYRLNDEWSLLGRVGYSRYDSALGTATTTGNGTDDGFFWSVGGRWQPFRNLELRALYGPDDNELRLSYNPSRRSSLEIQREERSVGVDAGEVVWSGQLQHRGRFTVWTVNYSEQTTTQAAALLEENTDDLIDDEGNLVFPRSSLGLSNDEFFRQRFEIDLDYLRGRSEWRLFGLWERREFDAEQEEEYGIGVAWTWRWSSRTFTTIESEWRQLSTSEGTSSNPWLAGVGVGYLLSRDTSAAIQYLHEEGLADGSDEEFQENRLNIFLRTDF